MSDSPSAEVGAGVAEATPERLRLAPQRLDAFSMACFEAAGAGSATARAATDAMMHAALCGIDSHGFRLLPHYVRVMVAGRLKPRPRMRFVRQTGATAVLDADDAHGALAAYTAMERAVELALAHGLGAVAIRRSSHFGAAGAFALRAAERGCIGLTVCNATAQVRLHDGAAKVHGTNPIAMAAPVADGPPWLLDMATSAAAFNKVRLHEALAEALPSGVGSDAQGRDTADPARVAMLAPLGAEFAYKGAGLAGLVEILSTALTGMALSTELLPMFGTDPSVPRRVGAFVLAVRPSAFIDQAEYDDAMRRYLGSLRASPALDGRTVHAPGDREWAQAEQRRRLGVPLDAPTLDALRALAREFAVEFPD